MSYADELEPWEAWLQDCWVARYTDEGQVSRSIYKTEQLFLAILSRFADPKQKEGTRLRRSHLLTVEDVYLNAPRGAQSGNYVVQVFDPFRASHPLFEKRYSTLRDAELELSVRLFQLDEIAQNFTEDEWDDMARFFDYDSEEWVVRPSE